MSSDAAAFRDELERRLEARAAGDTVALDLYRERVVVDRLLARLVGLAPERWSLTGPFALDLRFLHCVRLLRAVEIEWRTDRYDGFRAAPRLLESQDLGDHFEFRLAQSGMGIMGRQTFSNFEAHAFLAGEPFASTKIVFHLRYGEITTEPLLSYDLLAFAGVEPVELSAVLLELRVAEMLRRYSRSGDGGLDIIQAEDLIDLGEVGSRTHFQAIVLRDAIRGVFDLHGSHDPPESLPRPGGDTGVSAEDAETFRGIAERAGAPAELEETLDAVAALFDPILRGEVQMGFWDAHRQAWEPGNGHHSLPS